jgi:Kdo2-lipid IVA lauroyltransferase/acyltransferase
MIPLFRFFSRFPLVIAHAVGWVCGWGVFGASGVYRRRFLANARQAGMAWRQWLGAVGGAGMLVAELPRLWFGQPPAVQWDGADHIDAALTQGRGVVFLTPHLGCFEITAQAYARRYATVNAGRAASLPASHPGSQSVNSNSDAEVSTRAMTVLFRPPRKAWLHALITTARARPGLATAPTTLGGVKQIIKALKRGEAVGLLPDQVPPLGLGVWAPFFAAPAYTMTLPARLAQQTGAAVLIAWGERLAWGRGFCVHVQPLRAVLSADAALSAATVNAAMEDLVRACPQQYLWGYARYKSPRVAAGDTA